MVGSGGWAVMMTGTRKVIRERSGDDILDLRCLRLAWRQGLGTFFAFGLAMQGTYTHVPIVSHLQLLWLTMSLPIVRALLRLLHEPLRRRHEMMLLVVAVGMVRRSLRMSE